MNTPKTSAMKTITDEERLNWLAEQARKSPTGISFDWVPKCGGDPSGFRFMRRFHIGEPARTIREAIDKAMGGLQP